MEAAFEENKRIFIKAGMPVSKKILIIHDNQEYKMYENC
jgi:hypothetical protein